MAYQPFNYAAIPPQNLAKGITEGFQTGYLPFAAAQEREKQRIANELVKMQTQYIPKEYESNAMLQGAQAAQARANAGMAQAQMQMLQKYLSGGGEMGGYSQTPGMEISGQTQAGGQSMGMPGMPSQGTMMARQLAGLPPVMPQEQIMMDLYKSQQQTQMQKQLEKQMGTTSYVGDIQAQERGLRTSLPILEDLIAMNVPDQVLEKSISWNQQPAYKAQVSILTDKLIAAMGLPKSNESIEVVKKAIERQPRESEDAYKKRLGYLKHELELTQQGLQKELGGVKSIDKAEPAATSKLEEEAKARGFKKVDGVWVKP